MTEEVPSDEVDVPDVKYVIRARDLVKILSNSLDIDLEKLASILNLMRDYENYSLCRKPIECSQGSEIRAVKPLFQKKETEGLFFIPKKKGRDWLNEFVSKTLPGCYKYVRLTVAPSSIKGAGMGVFAVERIPKGAIGYYRGILKDEKCVNSYYSWTVKQFDRKTGMIEQPEEDVFYIDATNPKRSNWTRYVNCGVKRSQNNMEAEQIFDKIFYVATKTIEPGEELFIDYGVEYRRHNLGLRGVY
jgi:hypothetical protein